MGQGMLITASVPGVGASWWSVTGQLLASVVILLSVKQDLGLRRTRIGAALGSFMTIVFGTSALVTAVQANLRGGAVICAMVLCLETWLILRWVLGRQSKGKSQ
jgi:hypothetical protein